MKKVLFLVVAIAAISATSCKKCKDCDPGSGNTVELCDDELDTAEASGLECN